MRHGALVACLTVVLALCIAYPFLPGEYDPLAMPISFIAQGVGIVGLPLAVIGALWMLAPRFGNLWAILALAPGAMMALVLSMIAMFSAGKALGAMSLLAWVGIGVWLIRTFLRTRSMPPASSFHPAALYLAVLPIASLVLQLALAEPLTRRSKARAMSNAGQYIADIERSRALNGAYPASLHGQHRDHNTGVIGVEEYCYLSQGDSFNLSFEQPRFVLDEFGTREWVVYNPSDANRAFSHVVRLLDRDVHITGSGQGWYASGETGQPHWKYFLFD